MWQDMRQTCEYVTCAGHVSWSGSFYNFGHSLCYFVLSLLDFGEFKHFSSSKSEGIGLVHYISWLNRLGFELLPMGTAILWYHCICWLVQEVTDSSVLSSWMLFGIGFKVLWRQDP